MSSPSAAQVSGPTFNVAAYGANGNGSSDNTAAFARAITAAQSRGGGIVFVPPGRYSFSGSKAPNPASILIQGTVAITLQGAGRDVTSLVEAVPGRGLLSVLTDHTIVADLTLDTQTKGGGAAIFLRANHTSLLRTRVLGGAHHFAIYYAGPATATHAVPTYNVGNTVNDLVLNDLDCNDGFSWSFQEDSSISNVVHTGSRLALYVDVSTTVTNYQYTPGPQQCAARNGFWLTPPANDITIVNFVSSGEGGKVSVTGPGDLGRAADNVTIRGLTLTGTGDQLAIGNVRNLVLDDCNLGDNPIVIVAQQIAQGIISHCTYSQLVRRAAPGALVSLTVTS
jgi:Pectate lyase superfamily protein